MKAHVVQKLAGAVRNSGDVAHVNGTAVRCAYDKVLQVPRIRDELTGLYAYILVISVEAPRQHAGVRSLNRAAQIQRRDTVGGHPGGRWPDEKFARAAAYEVSETGVIDSLQAGDDLIRHAPQPIIVAGGSISQTQNGDLNSRFMIRSRVGSASALNRLDSCSIFISLLIRMHE